MTSEERIEALLHGLPVDRVPLFGEAQGFNALNVGYEIADYYSNPEKAVQAAAWTIEQYNWDRLPFLALAPLGTSAFGGEIKWPHSEFSQAPSIERLPVQSEDDAWNLQMPDVKSAGLLPILQQFALQAEEAGFKHCFVAPDEVFLGASNLCGIDTLCRWTIRKPDLVHHLMRPTTENTIISPKTFEEFVLPYSKELHERLMEIGFKHMVTHICGDQLKNYPFWAQIPMGKPGIVSVSQEVDLEEAMKFFPSDIIMGNISPPLIQAGTPSEVYEEAARCICKGKNAPGGFILAPGCELPPKAPPHNVWMIMKAVNDFGWYD
jgi:uroporphyrinogen decarboxylase